MALVIFILVDVVTMILWRIGWVLKSEDSFSYAREFINFAFLGITIALFIWTVTVYKTMKESLEQKELLCQLCKQVNLFFSFVIFILSFRAIVETVLCTIWFLSELDVVHFDYVDKQKTYMTKLFIDSTIEIFLNYFLIYHLFRNQTIDRSEATQPSSTNNTKQDYQKAFSKEKKAVKSRKQDLKTIDEGSEANYSEPLLH